MVCWSTQAVASDTLRRNDGAAPHYLLNLHVVPTSVRSREILRGINLSVRKGEVHAIMGRNGSGMTTLA